MTMRLAIVGCGAIANYLHAPAIVASQNCKLVAVVDADRDRAAKFARSYPNTTVVDSIADLAGVADAVVLATPPHTRVALVEQALAVGMHVVCEKPAANTIAECGRIAELAATRNRTVAVCHQFRFWPARRKVRQLLETGELPQPVRITVSQGAPYSWNSATGYTVRRELVPGGVLINAGTHPLDTLLSWFGDPLHYEYFDDACGGLESNVRMQAWFANNLELDFRLSRTCQLENEIQLHWPDAVLAVNNSDPFHYFWRAVDAKPRDVKCGESSHGYHQPAIDLYDDFAMAVESGRSPEVDIHEGARVIRWIEGCYQRKHERNLPTVAPIPGATW